MKTWNVTINGKYAGTVAGDTERAAALAASNQFNAAAHDCLIVTRVELGRKHHSDTAIAVAKSTQSRVSPSAGA
mgnify:CR=1 FL=1